MFTGIVEDLGSVASLNGARLRVGSSVVAHDTAVGASVAVNGVCLTVVERARDGLSFDLSDETMRRTALGGLRPGDRVNLERPVTPSTRLGGHIVQGHVDGVGRIASIEPGPDGGAWLSVEAPQEVARYLIEKGSIGVDGVSLTVAALDGARFSVALIPHTLDATTLGSASAGDPVNLEVDVIAKYVERLLEEART
jgi:riboflavin synthase